MRIYRLFFCFSCFLLLIVRGGRVSKAVGFRVGSWGLSGEVVEARVGFLVFIIFFGRSFGDDAYVGGVVVYVAVIGGVEVSVIVVFVYIEVVVFVVVCVFGGGDYGCGEKV